MPDTTHAAVPRPPVLVRAGDIAGGAWTGDVATARILDTSAGPAFTTGDKKANGEVRLASTFGVLLHLEPGRYRWSFIGVDGVARGADAADCH